MYNRQFVLKFTHSLHSSVIFFLKKKKKKFAYNILTITAYFLYPCPDQHHFIIVNHLYTNQTSNDRKQKINFKCFVLVHFFVLSDFFLRLTLLNVFLRWFDVFPRLALGVCFPRLALELATNCMFSRPGSTFVSRVYHCTSLHVFPVQRCF